MPGESTSTSKEETPSAVSEAEQENNADNEMSAEVAKESTESDKPSEEIKDEQSVPDLENVEEEIKSKENLNEDVKVGDKRDSSSENPDCMVFKKNIKFIFFQLLSQNELDSKRKIQQRRAW